MHEKDIVGVNGYIKDDLGHPLTDVSISYRTSLISVKTNSKGEFNINKPRTLFIEFKKDGYHTLSTSITNFSEEASYNFKTITLKKSSNSEADYEDISLNTDSELKKLKLFGTVLNAFKEPLNNVIVTLTNSITESYSLSKYGNSDGSFNFKKQTNQIIITKEGFEELGIDLPVYEKDSLKITLLEHLNKKGIYFISSGKYISLPQTKLSYKSEKKIGRVLWGGNFSYDETDFFYPENIKKFKIEKDSVLRFVIYEPAFSSHIFKSQNDDGYLCTANYKGSVSPVPSAAKKLISVNEIYPPKYSKSHFNSPKIIDFKPLHTNLNYVFVNSKNKKGFYFTY
jgi:hypothetical protein